MDDWWQPGTTFVEAYWGFLTKASGLDDEDQRSHGGGLWGEEHEWNWEKALCCQKLNDC